MRGCAGPVWVNDQVGGDGQWSGTLTPEGNLVRIFIKLVDEPISEPRPLVLQVGGGINKTPLLTVVDTKVCDAAFSHFLASQKIETVHPVVERSVGGRTIELERIRNEAIDIEKRSIHGRGFILSILCKRSF